MGRRSLLLLTLCGVACASSVRRTDPPGAPRDATPDVALDAALDGPSADDADDGRDAAPDAPADAPDTSDLDVATPADLPPDALPMDAATPDAPVPVDATADAAPDVAPDRAPLPDVPADTAACAADPDCPAGTFCELPGRCVPWRCFPGQTYCVSSTRARVCDARGAGTAERECGDGCIRDECRALTACEAPRRRCGGLCVDVTNDQNNCGACGHVCQAYCPCAAGSCACVCPGGSTNCSGVCRDLSTDRGHCGRCGSACAAGLVCVAGACRAPPPAMTTVVASLQSADCAVVDHAAHNGRERGGLAAVSSGVYHNGSARTAMLAGPTLIPAMPLPVSHDGLVSDLTTGLAYTARDAGGVEFAGVARDATAPFTVTQLVPLPPSFAATIPTVRLSREVALYHDAGFFAGWRYVILYSGGVGSARAWHLVSVATGAVLTLPAAEAPLPHPTCPNGAWWGIAERTADSPRVVYLRDARTVVRTSLADHRTEVVATVPDLGAACAITASSRAGRWYVHHTGPSSFARTGEVVTGACPATFATVPL